MKNELAIINEQEILGKKFEMYGTIENPLFLAKSVGEWIDYDLTSINKMVSKVDEDEKLNGTIFLSGQNREVTMLTEDGLYEVLMQSRKPIAKKLKKEIKKILKQMRLTGGSVVKGREVDFIENYFPTFSEDTKLKMVIDLQTQNEEYKNKIEELKPQAEYYLEVLNKPDLIDLRIISKDLGMTANKLGKIMHFNRIIYPDNNGVWIPYDKYNHLIPEGYADYQSYTNPNATLWLKWTEKGRQWIIENLSKWKDNYYNID